MHRWLISSVIVVFLAVSVVYADLPQNFEDFLLKLDEDAEDQLYAEMERTKAEIEKLLPQIEKLEAEYKEQEEKAVANLLFYQLIGLDTLFQFVIQSENLVDVLANIRLIEKKLEEDLESLEVFYFNYMLRKVAKESLDRNQSELAMIERNLAARERFLAEHGHLSSEEMLQVLHSFWQEEVESPLKQAIDADSKTLNEQLSKRLVQVSSNTYHLEEASWNKESELSYYFDPAHIYVHYSQGETDVILIGIMHRESGQENRMLFEGGFVNGMYIPLEWIIDWKGLHFDFSALHSNGDFFVELRNQMLIIQKQSAN